MNILLTNDDGIHSSGLWALHKAFAPHHTVSVIAPDRERSAVGHGITLMDPIRAKKTYVSKHQWGYAVTGTPADCIKLGILELLDKKPDMVISGINPGANTGVNINYSGTVAAAKEATLYGIPSIAASIHGFRPDYYDEAAGFILKLAKTTIEKGRFGTVAAPRDVHDISNKFEILYKQWLNLRKLPYEGNLRLRSDFTRKKLTHKLAQIMLTSCGAARNN